MKKYNIAVVGATGLVGTTMLKVLEEKDIRINKLFCYASKKSKGKTVKFKGTKYPIIVLSKKNISGKKIDFALFSAGSSVSKEFAPIFLKAGAKVIDNSNAFRMDKYVPLVVPQVNIETAKTSKIIANPNCSTIQCMAPLYALNERFNLKRVNYTTFQAVSGSGLKGIKDLENTLKGEKPKFYPYTISNNCLPHIGKFLKNGYTEEEMKMINETKKILNLPKIKVSATCVRVPVKNSHAVQIQAEFEKPITRKKVFKTLNNAKSVTVIDDIKNNIYPTNEMASNKDDIYVGRIRVDLSSKKTVHMYVVADNIRRGAASNAVEILQQLTNENNV